MKQNVSPCSLVVELLLFELLSKVEGTKEGHHKLAIPAYSNNSLSGVFQNKILPVDL